MFADIKKFISMLLLALLALTANAQTIPLQQHLLKTSDGGQIAYYEIGQGSPLILITGFGGMASQWSQPFVATLAQQHQVIIFDNRGIGSSIAPKNSAYTMDDLAGDTAQLIHGLGYQHAAVLGWSMGGMIAQRVAVLYPERVTRLILLSTAIAGKQAVPTPPDVYTEMRERSGTAAQAFARAVTILFPPDQQATMKNILAKDGLPITPPEPPLNQHTFKLQDAMLTAWFNNDTDAADLAKIKIPVLVLGAADDVILPVKNAEILAQTIPDAQLKIYPDAGHAAIYQYPQQIASDVNKFLAK